jgi:hypothetical protein
MLCVFGSKYLFNLDTAQPHVWFCNVFIFGMPVFKVVCRYRHRTYRHFTITHFCRDTCAFVIWSKAHCTWSLLVRWWKNVRNFVQQHCYFITRQRNTNTTCTLTTCASPTCVESLDRLHHCCHVVICCTDVCLRFPYTWIFFKLYELHPFRMNNKNTMALPTHPHPTNTRTQTHVRVN